MVHIAGHGHGLCADGRPAATHAAAVAVVAATAGAAAAATSIVWAAAAKAAAGVAAARVVVLAAAAGVGYSCHGCARAAALLDLLHQPRHALDACVQEGWQVTYGRSERGLQYGLFDQAAAVDQRWSQQ
jgi:hypothetical protein